MNNSQIALLLVRLSGFQFVIVGLNFLTYLPERMMMASHTSLPLSSATAQVETKMLIARAILHITLGVALWFFSRPVIRFFIADAASSDGNDSQQISR